MRSIASIWTDSRRRAGLAAAVFVATLLAAAPTLEAQEGAPTGLAEIFATFVRLMFVWGCGGWIVWFAGLILSGRLLGLEMTFLRVLGITLLAPLLVLLPALLLIFLLHETVGSAALGWIVQTVYFAGEVFAIKVICDTDYPRAVLTLLMALTLALVVMAVLMFLTF